MKLSDAITSVFGYAVGAIFVAMLLSIPGYGIYQVGKNVWYLNTFDHSSGEVVRCKKEIMGSKKNRRVMWGPVVEVNDGYRVYPNTYSRKNECEGLIGKQLKVLLHPSDPSRGVINTFNQLWMFPLLSIVVSVLVVFWGKRRPKKQKNNE